MKIPGASSDFALMPPSIVVALCHEGWHIDGCASEFEPGVTDHFGEIHNFTALVGVLLSDVPEPMSGELCCCKKQLFAFNRDRASLPCESGT